MYVTWVARGLGTFAMTIQPFVIKGVNLNLHRSIAPKVVNFCKKVYRSKPLTIYLRINVDFRWGNDLYEEVELSYSRNRIVECYFWSYTVHYEQQYGHARIILAKVFVLTSMLDDTFDMHATLEEARKITEAIQRLAIISLY